VGTEDEETWDIQRKDKLISETEQAVLPVHEVQKKKEEEEEEESPYILQRSG
jgi:hypothetical protein